MTVPQQRLADEALAWRMRVNAGQNSLEESIDDRVASLLVAGSNIGLLYNDVAGTLTISASGGSGGGGIPEAPTDSVAYGRENLSWVPVLALSNDTLDGGNF